LCPYWFMPSVNFVSSSVRRGNQRQSYLAASDCR
jgi:hypothetical protein